MFGRRRMLRREKAAVSSSLARGFAYLTSSTSKLIAIRPGVLCFSLPRIAAAAAALEERDRPGRVFAVSSDDGKVARGIVRVRRRRGALFIRGTILFRVVGE